MKKFTCREIMNGEGGCDAVFTGATAMDVAKQCSAHVMGAADEAHTPMRDMMAESHSEEEKQKWWDWFTGEWDKKPEA